MQGSQEYSYRCQFRFPMLPSLQPVNALSLLVIPAAMSNKNQSGQPAHEMQADRFLIVIHYSLFTT